MLKGKIVVNFGDSIFGNKRPPNDISTFLSKITSAAVYNCGFGGCRMSSHVSNWDAFCMYRLADAITTGDFSIQENVDVYSVEGMPEYFIETLKLLKSVDFSEVDIITISYGTNDFTAGVKLDNPDNNKDINTFNGALRYSIETILKTHPHIKIYLCGQTYRYWMDNQREFIEDSDTKRFNGLLISDFVYSTEMIAKEYHIPFIDNYFSLGINKYNYRYYFPENDGTHHNIRGAKLIAENIAHNLK